MTEFADGLDDESALHCLHSLHLHIAHTHCLRRHSHQQLGNTSSNDAVVTAERGTSAVACSIAASIAASISTVVAAERAAHRVHQRTDGRIAQCRCRAQLHVGPRTELHDDDGSPRYAATH